MGETIQLERVDDTAVLVLNRPRAYNAFDLPMIRDLADHLVTLASDSSVRAVVLTGAPPAFSAGGDLRWASAWPAGPGAAFHELSARFHMAIQTIRRMPQPVIAAVNGMAAGGGFSLALAADFRVMDETAEMRQAFTSNGLSMDGGATFILPRLVGLARALEIAAFDEPIPASRALAWGLVTRVSPAGRAREEALVLARDLGRRSAVSWAWSKTLLTDSLATSFETQIERERLGLKSAALSADGREGLAAFAEKRPPVFQKR
jgi:2-(1,2-epoxy-1,2-dihydrophenyl)acetyl-CoA isomerase